MPQLSPDQLDDCIERADVQIANNKDDIELDARLAFLYELNAELKKDGGQAGTHAYDMMAAVEDINAGNTRVLIELIAGVVIAKAREAMENGVLDEKATELSVTFQPSDIDDMQRAYDMAVKRDGMHVTVTLTKKSEPTESWQLDEEESGEGALEQAAEAPERPVWAVRTGDGHLHGWGSRKEAENAVRDDYADEPLAHVENRYCLHEDCPSEGCNHAEATSNA